MLVTSKFFSSLDGSEYSSHLFWMGKKNLIFDMEKLIVTFMNMQICKLFENTECHKGMANMWGHL